MKHIARKSLLYKTEVEYSDYTANHVQGCSHGCKYPCYAMMMAKRFGLVKSYEDWCGRSLPSAINTVKSTTSKRERLPQNRGLHTRQKPCRVSRYEYFHPKELSVWRFNL